MDEKLEMLDPVAKPRKIIEKVEGKAVRYFMPVFLKVIVQQT